MVGGLVLAVARMRHDDLDGGAVESHGGGSGTVAASFRRTMIPRRALAAAQRWDTHDDVVRHYERVDGRRDDADRQRRQMGARRRPAIDKGSNDDDDCDDGDSDGGRHPPVVPP